METLYDVQQLFKQFGMYIYVGARIYDIELMNLEGSRKESTKWIRRLLGLI